MGKGGEGRVIGGVMGVCGGGWSGLVHLKMLKTTITIRKISDVAMKRKILVCFPWTQVCRRPTRLGRGRAVVTSGTHPTNWLETQPLSHTHT